MSDFSPSGIIDLPVTTLESLRAPDSRVLGWLREAVTEGDRLNRSDPSYDDMGKGMAYIAGEHAPTAVGGSGGPAYLPGVQTNESRRVVQAHVAALTDLQPVFAYKSMNPAFTLQADLLNKLTIASWITNLWDVTLGDCVKYALAAGTADLLVEWDPRANGWGDISLSARDARDTLPIRPALHTKSIQAWEGVVLREAYSINAMRGLFPERADAFRPSTDSILSTLMGVWRRMTNRIQSPAADTLAGLDQPSAAIRKGRSGDILMYRTWINDRTRNLTSKPIPMGTPGSSWAYVVPPKEFLYPFKRMILATPETILYDGPSPFWHGQYPVNRLKLWDLPWQFLGTPLLKDLTPLQDGMNHTLQGLLLALDKWLNPAVSYNRRAVSESFMRLFDPRRPGAKVKLTDEGVKEGFKIHEGPAPQAMQLGLELFQLLINRFDNLSGTPNMQELLALRQLPSDSTIQKYWEMMTPEIRQEGRQMEAFLRPVAEQMKVLRFQYESQPKRVTILGDAGKVLEDIDFDPNVMVPAMKPGDAGYQADLDHSLPRDVRAQNFHKSVVFMIAPNSLLAMNATEGKMMRFQMARMGLYDAWSLAETLDIPNFGAPPAIPLPPLNQEAAMQEIVQMLGQPNGLQLLSTKYLQDPMSGQWLEIRTPITVTERLIAQQQLGLGMTENPAGRKASGEAPPKMEQKSDGRTTVTESRHASGPNGS